MRNQIMKPMAPLAKSKLIDNASLSESSAISLEFYVTWFPNHRQRQPFGGAGLQIVPK
jgi:hypothetical protein